ncbi:hypothetical protein JW813_05170 [Clostridium botulinum]|uniref:hypothetical protein n=1 Tax=Clostridium botulinum TaxID=1491 RepID=UPI001C9BB0DC|nr:hypothetical protein [Clostridium botulinum]MBY7023626.1 hypothetical protein [Clostridium botulinum]UZP04399.1 hypothetical protein JW813_05170 [Clostridium botulinum]UZP07757.1 hypothetical protein JYA71_05165 [Clostridium botulinum]UZP07811.1 hypothetical protein JYA71_05445 [Clostridium botulinum]UZP11138.1 hypothetical protein JYA74_05165 [Clostridium botulinum]
MYSYKTVIDSNGFVIEKCVLFIDNIPQYFEVTEDMQTLEMYKGDLIKPKWSGVEWVEGATQEEIQEWEESNKPLVPEPTETDLLKQQLLETQNLVLELQEQILLNKQIK